MRATGTRFYHPSPQYIYDGGTPPPSPCPSLQVAASILILVSLTYTRWSGVPIYHMGRTMSHHWRHWPLAGNKPLNPSLAISIRMLELYRRLRLQKPSFSVEVFAKVVCDLYSVSLATTTLPSEYKLIVFRFHINEASTQHWGMHLMCILLYYEVWISKLHRCSVTTRPTGESSMRVLCAHTRFVGVEWTTKQSLIYIFSLKMNPHAPSVI